MTSMEHSTHPRTVPTLVDVLEHWGEVRANERALTFLLDGEAEAAVITFADLRDRARAVAVEVAARAQAGDRALLSFSSGPDFVAAFFGCLYAGVIAVPVVATGREQHEQTLRNIAADARPSVILAQASELSVLRERLGEQAGTSRHWIAADQVDGSGSAWRRPPIGASTLAMLQYTSGSTGAPKGVMIDHAAILNEERMISSAFGHDEHTVLVGWLPLFHDMGLIGNLLWPIYLGRPAVLMPPEVFLRKPSCWLRAISRYRGTVSGAPNFAYELCLRQVQAEERVGLDLSSWKVAYNGSERVRKATLERFAHAFEPCGFRREAVHPCYGLAEATLLVTGGFSDRTPTVDRPRAVNGERPAEHVSSGAPQLEERIVIVDPDSRRTRDECHVGEVWVAGPNVARGYWERPEATQATFAARTVEGEGPYLRTGDLGFLKGGELFVTGRLKEVLKVRGRTHYPEDIELSVALSHAALAPHRIAAFSVDCDGEEQLVVAAEVRRSHAEGLDSGEVLAAVRRRVLDDHGLHLAALVPLKPRSLPVTSSGKLKRRACRQGYLDGELAVLASPPAVAQENEAASACADELLAWLRDYARTRLNSRLMDERRCVPPNVVLDFGNRGLFGLQVAKHHGGLELGWSDTVRVLEQLGAIDLTLCLLVGMHNVLGAGPIARHATAGTRDELLPRLATGRELAAFALTEPGAGSNPRAIAATAMPAGPQRWSLRGTKCWSGLAAWAGAINVFVQHRDERGKHAGVSAFILRQDRPGLRHGPEAPTMGMRGIVQNEVLLEGVVVESCDLLGQPGAGFSVAQEAMQHGRLAIAAACVGAMERCAQLMLRYASRRSVSSGRLLANAAALERLSHLTAAVDALRALVGRVAAALDRGETVPDAAFAACKIAGPELLWRSADDLVQLLGGRGYIETNIAPQILRDARVLRIFEGPTETLSAFLGSAATTGRGDLFQFLGETLGASEVAARLHAAVAELPGAESGSPAAEQWRLDRAGRLATCAILMAAAPRTGRTADWARAQFDDVAARAASGPPAFGGGAEALAREITGYASTIGDLEQTLAGEDSELDPYLRREGDEARTPNSVTPPEGSSRANGSPESAASLETWLATRLADRLKLDAHSIDRERPFAELGLDSLMAAELALELSRRVGRPVDETLLWQCPTIRTVAASLTGEPPDDSGARILSDLEDLERELRSA
jgi:acyl-CoA synthetase (AMP-forming)/AMP-acid ligase II/alkylation response protein AidB-like acyl-CoA dehydrogenase/acyl carrier protein